MNAPKWILATLVLMPAGVSLYAQPPVALDLADGGIRFPDGSILDSAAAVDPPTAVTVAVDCTAGDKVADALETPAEALILEIDGVCHENVVIRRSQVTLTGDDPMTDRIEGVSTGASPEPSVVWVRGAREVEINSLGLVNGAGNGLLAEDAKVVSDSCRFVGNARSGVVAVSSADVQMTKAVISGNTRGGVLVNRASRLMLWDSELDQVGTNRWAALAYAAGYIYLYDSQITGENGVSVFMSGFVYGEDTSISVNEVALLSSEQGDVNWYGNDEVPAIAGAVQVDWKALVWMLKVNQTAVGATESNLVSRDSTLLLADVTLQGLDLEIFSNGSVSGSSSLGAVTCATGSDLLCTGVAVTSSSCLQCPVPP